MLSSPKEDFVIGCIHVHAHENVSRDKAFIRKTATVEAQACMLYGADIGENTRVEKHR